MLRWRAGYKTAMLQGMIFLIPDEQVLSTAILLAAVAMDLLLGDPHRLPHPVRWLGWLAHLLEKFFRSSTSSPSMQQLLGAGCAVFMLCLAGAVAGAAVVFLPLEGLVALYLSYAGLALGQLRREARRVLVLTANQDDLSRKALQMLVSRDTSQLTVNQVRRTLAETVSENASDGFVAPFFYVAFFGPPGLWAYKAISTLDSMWGYKTPRHLHFGRAAAKLDDILNYLPARLTAVAILLVAWLRGHLGGYTLARLKRAWRFTVRDANTMASPNAGWPMAAAAWGMGAGMGGEAVYHGRTVVKPWIGPPQKAGASPREWSQARCEALLEVCTAACLVCVVFLHLLALLLAGLGVFWLGYFTG